MLEDGDLDGTLVGLLEVGDFDGMFFGMRRWNTNLLVDLKLEIIEVELDD